MIERVQRKYLQFMSYSLSCLSDHRSSSGLRFLTGLISIEINFSALLSNVNFKVSARLTRTIPPFYVPFLSFDYAPIIVRIMHLVNADPTFLVINGDSLVINHVFINLYTHIYIYIFMFYLLVIFIFYFLAVSSLFLFFNTCYICLLNNTHFS